MNVVDILGYIVIPCIVASSAAVFAIVKGVIRFAQYLTHTEESLDKVARSNEEIRDEVRGYKSETEQRFHDAELKADARHEAITHEVHGIDRRLYVVEKVVERSP